MQLTYSQCKAINDAYGMDWRDTIEALKNQPDFIRYAEYYHHDSEAWPHDWFPSDGPMLTVSEIQMIQHCGCGAGYMPAVTYHTANVVMSYYGDDVLDYISEELGELPQCPDDISWSGLAVFYLSCAIELWCGQFNLDGVEC